MSFDTDPFIDAELAGTDVNSKAWVCINKPELLTFAPQREANEELPDGGSFPFNEVDDEQTVDLRWVMTGTVAPDGAPYDNPAEGLAANKRLFAAAYFRAERDEFGTVACDVTDIDGTEYTGRVKTRRPMFSDGLFECGVVMPVNIYSGELAEAGS